MRLKQLEVVGLKSFANKTTLDFHSGVTAIVGPNGCGKSNVVDAIRWVLGEQSAKHLRGDSMEDVIFKGNGRLGPAGMAEVSLTFENDAPAEVLDDELDVSTLPSHFRNLSEITVSRRYFRSGESEYAINRTPCRLRDITELFLGTGIGSKAYAIIEQGRVEQLINSKPEDRRLFLEEAGGTTLYRSRRLAAERKIERTRENLLRVTDVARELERQIQYLNRLAKKAERYRAVRDESREIELQLGRHRWLRLCASAGAETKELESLHAQQAQLREEAQQLDGEREQRGAAQRVAEEALATLRESAASSATARDSAEERVAMLRNELAERARREARLTASREGLLDRGRQVEAELATAAREVESLTRTLESDRGQVTEGEERLTSVRAAVVAARTEVEHAKSKLLAIVSAEADARNEATRLERLELEAERRRRKAESDAHLLGEQASAAEHAQANRQASQARLTASVVRWREARDATNAALAELSTRLGAAQRSLRECREAAVRAASTADSLRQLHDAYEGYAPVVRELLLGRETSLPVLGVVADAIMAPPEWEAALAAALGARIQCLVVPDARTGADALQMLRERRGGRGSFVAQAGSRRAVNAEADEARSALPLKPLLALVSVEPAFADVAATLLGGVFLAPDLESALAAYPLCPPGVTLVTRDGDLLDADGVFTGGSADTGQQELLSRRRRLDEAEAGAVEASAHATEAEAVLAALQKEHAEVAARLADEEQAVRRAAAELSAVDRDLERLRLDIPRVRDRLRLTRFERDAARRDAASAVSGRVTVRAKLAGLSSERADLDAGLAQANQTLAQDEAAIEEALARLRVSSAAMAERQQRLASAETTFARLQAESEALASRLAAIGEELVEIALERSGIEQSIEASVGAVEGRRQEAANLTDQVTAARAVLAAAVEATDQCAARFDAVRVALDAARERAGRLEVSLAENRTRREHLEADIAEKYEVVLCEMEGEFVALEPEVEHELSERARSLRESLSRMGEVDTGAIEQLRELEERAEYLRTQQADLEHSIADLERTIQKLNRISRERFAETFTAVNAKFQEIAPRLFRGGEARLVLTDPSNMLETGVDIFVRPPGKQLDSVTLLSGGEKALVAVSLIFSLFLINPTPFCFLDEVDAPLDDANIGRFSGLVREMSTHSQFIVITHNKRTMEAAHALYGVTMEEPGISKVVSVAPIAASE